MRFEFRHYAFLGDDSQVAARSAECAAQQGLFMEFHDAVFEQWSADAFGGPNNKRIAAEIGVDSSRFNKCLDQARVQKYVDADFELATQMGVNSTPSIFINGRPVTGLAEFDVYEQIILEEINKTTHSGIGIGAEGDGCGPSEGDPDCG